MRLAGLAAVNDDGKAGTHGRGQSSAAHRPLCPDHSGPTSPPEIWSTLDYSVGRSRGAACKTCLNRVIAGETSIRPRCRTYGNGTGQNNDGDEKSRDNGAFRGFPRSIRSRLSGHILATSVPATQFPSMSEDTTKAARSSRPAAGSSHVVCRSTDREDAEVSII